MSTPIEAQIEALIAPYSPEIAAQIEACRRKLRALVPRGYELIYDNYNALAFGFASADKASAAILSIAAYPRWVTLFFLHGVDLNDPDGLLKGDGSRVRSIRLKSPADLDDPRVRQLMDQALAPHRGTLAQAPETQAIIKSVSAKQRSRRPAQ